MILVRYLVEFRLRKCQGFIEELDVKAGVERGTRDRDEEREVAEELRICKLLVVLLVAGDADWLADRLEKFEKDLLEDVVVLDFCLDDKGYRHEVKVTFAASSVVANGWGT